jgi:cytochrome c oxidase assembly protein subunit 11
VQFNADVDPNLPWTFRPAQRSVTVPVGEETLAFYEAVNRADHAVVGRAVYNVTPFKIGSYFSKIHCFCFEEQTLQSGERVEMPVSFYVDPAMLEDANTSEVRQITLSYTFFIDHEATAKLREQTRGGSTS